MGNGESRARFCMSCGAEIRGAGAFCMACGAQVANLPSAVAPPPPAWPSDALQYGEQPLARVDSNPVAGVVGNASYAAGLMGLKRTSYTIIVRRERLIFAQVTKEMATAAVEAASGAAKTSGKGFFGRWGAQLGAVGGIADRYYHMSTDQTLAENPGNWCLERAQVNGIKVKSGSWNEDAGHSDDRLTIKSSEGKFRFYIGNNAGEVKRLLREAGWL